MNRKVHVAIAQNAALNDNYAISNTFHHLIFCLSKRDELRLSVISGSSARTGEPLFGDNISHYEVDTSMHSILGNLRYSFLTYVELKRIHRNKSIDIVHARYPLSSLIAAALFKKRISPQTKIVYDIGSPWIEMMGERFRLLSNRWVKKGIYAVEKNLFRSVDAFYFQNEDVAAYYQERIPSIKPKPCGYLHFELNSFIFKPKPFNEAIAQELGIEKGDIVLGVVAGLGKMRQLDFIIKGFAKCREQSGLGNLRMVIVGGGPERRNLQRLVNRMNLDEAIKFTGQVDHPLVPEYLSIVDIGISHLPNKMVFEVSSPLKLMEYLACGLPVLASNVIAHRRLRRHSSNVFVYNNNLQSFCDQLNCLLENLPSKDAVLQDVESLERHFGSATIADNLVKLYATLLP